MMRGESPLMNDLNCYIMKKDSDVVSNKVGQYVNQQEEHYQKMMHNNSKSRERSSMNPS